MGISESFLKQMIDCIKNFKDDWYFFISLSFLYIYIKNQVHTWTWFHNLYQIRMYDM